MAFSSGQVLNAADLNPRGGQWRRVANQAISNSTTTVISWDTEDADTMGLLTPTSGTATIPSGASALYAITALVIFSAGPGTSALEVSVSGTIVAAGAFQGFAKASACCVTQLSAASTIQVSVTQTSGGSLNATGRLDIWRIAG